MEKKKNRWLGILFLVSIPVMMITAAGSADSRTALTVVNTHVDGSSQDLCKGADSNCNLYAAKESVWLNGSPNTGAFGTDGVYFFAVLEPGGQPNPNDLGGFSDKNLSDDFDCYQNRIFNVKGGEISAYTGNIDCSAAGYTDYILFSHWLDSGRKEPGPGNPKPNGQPPLIRLFPYADSVNPGGVYVLAICSLEDGYPVDPRRCSYDAFKVESGEQKSYSFFLDGYKVADLLADGFDGGDPGVEGFKIAISGTGPDGFPIKAEALTDAHGYWSFTSKTYTFPNKEKPQDVFLNLCDSAQEGWTHSYPDDGNCYEISFTPNGFSRFTGVNFGDWQPIDVTACVVHDPDGRAGGDVVPVQGWTVSLTEEGSVIGSQQTGADGCYTWSGLRPGSSYDVHDEMLPGWTELGVTDWAFLSDQAYSGGSLVYTFVNASLQGCTADFWREGIDSEVVGQALWDAASDPDWRGEAVQPYSQSSNFCEFFGNCIGENSMFDYVNYQNGTASSEREEAFNQAARSLVAAYLNASWGMNYSYSTTQLMMKWSDAIEFEERLLALNQELDAANQAFNRQDSLPTCPITASLK